MELNEKTLVERGYHKYKPSRFDGQFVIAKYQKRFDDDIGKKYFLDVKEYDNSAFERSDILADKYQHEFELYLEFGESDKPMKILMYCGWTLEEAEEMAELMWKSLGANYYERWYEVE